ncbi:MAG: choice-of-anchor J domain-containing protein [Ignavibacteriaceae bacterium]
MLKFYSSFLVLILIFVLTFHNGYAQNKNQTARSTKKTLSELPLMKKSQFPTSILNKQNFITNNASTDPVYFSEDFDGIPGPTAGGAGTYAFPSGWVLSNVDGLVPSASVSYVNEAWERREDFKFTVGDSAAFSTSWYEPSGQADDWMISPSISIGAHTILTWNAVAYDPDFPDGYEVRISTTTQNVAGCLANPALFSVTAENSAWTQRSVDLTAAGYSNQTVYIAWRNHSTDKFLLLIDDIVVKENLQYDVQLVSVLQPSEYTMIPAWQNYSLDLGGYVKNNGQSNLSNVELTANIYQNGTLVHTEVSSPITSLLPDTTVSINLNPYTPVDTGIVEIEYSVSIAEADEDYSNDSGSASPVYISENEFARDDNVATGSLGIGAGNGGELGLSYDLKTAGYIRGVKFFLTRCYPNQPLYAYIRNFENGKPTDLIAETDTLYAPDEDARWITLNIYGGEAGLPTDTIVVILNEVDSTLALGTSNSIFTPGTGWVNWPTSPFGTWANVEDFGTSFSHPFMLRPLIYEESLLTGVEPFVTPLNKYNLFQNYPNPFNPSTTINYQLSQDSYVTLKIYDVLGNEVKTIINENKPAGNYNIDFNASALASGVYFYELRTNDFVSSKKMILMK